ncbi:MAG: Gfo/Idh/MocA family oxidoreductase [Candidatus Omnitrophica bacterium]|nr:Gfo/Idh/MocA family oxidoreductase [Candidatus Omnitrophota bacterium]
MSRIIKWGVIGSGGIARRRTIPEGILPSRNSELRVVFDINADANQSAAQEFNATAAGSLDELLKSDIDAVYIASPANAHFEHAQQCAQAGKHVLCEKPLGLNVEEAEAMIQACQNHNVLLGAALMMRFHSQHQAALSLIQQGKLGKPVFGRAQLSCWYPPIEGAWRQDPAEGGGGSLIDMGGHCIDLLEMFFGPVKKVSCFIHNTIHSYSSEDSAAALLFFENGAMASVDAFFCIPDASSKNMLELYGSQGSILAKGTIGQDQAGEMIAYLEDDADYDALQKRSNGEGLVINPPPVNTYKAEVEEFADAVLEGREPSNNAQLGLRSQKILTACYESALSGCIENV